MKVCDWLKERAVNDEVNRATDEGTMVAGPVMKAVQLMRRESKGYDLNLSDAGTTDKEKHSSSSRWPWKGCKANLL